MFEVSSVKRDGDARYPNGSLVKISHPFSEEYCINTDSVRNIIEILYSIINTAAVILQAFSKLVIY